MNNDGRRHRVKVEKIWRSTSSSMIVSNPKDTNAQTASTSDTCIKPNKNNISMEMWVISCQFCVLATMPCHWVSSPELEIYVIYSPMSFVYFLNTNEGIFNEIRDISVLQLNVYLPKTLDS